MNEKYLAGGVIEVMQWSRRLANRAEPRRLRPSGSCTPEEGTWALHRSNCGLVPVFVGVGMGSPTSVGCYHPWSYYLAVWLLLVRLAV